MKLSSSGDGYFIPDVEFNDKSIPKNQHQQKLIKVETTKKKPDTPLSDSNSYDSSDDKIYSNSTCSSPNYVNRIIYKMDVAGAVFDESN